MLETGGVQVMLVGPSSLGYDTGHAFISPQRPILKGDTADLHLRHTELQA